MSSLLACRPRGLAFGAACALSLALSFAAPAHAQDKALAESLFNAGKTAMDAGDYKAACRSFAESQKQDPSVGTLLNLGRCHELQGRLATAWGHYKEAARFAQLKSDPDRGEAARKLAADLEPKLSKLTVTSAASVPGLVVTRIRKEGAEGDRVEMSGGAIGVPIDVDAGQYTIEASAPGFKPWITEVTVGKDADRQTVAIPALEAAPAGSEPPPAGGGATEPPVAEGSDGSTFIIAGAVVGGIGVIGLGLGAIMGISASGTASDAEDDPTLCPEKQCTEAGLAEIDSAKSSATVSTIGFVVGGVALAGGAALLFYGLSQDGGGATESASALQVTPVASHEGGGLWLDGSF